VDWKLGLAAALLLADVPGRDAAWADVLFLLDIQQK
jgi:hypothetical protein